MKKPTILIPRLPVTKVGNIKIKNTYITFQNRRENNAFVKEIP